MELTLSIFSIHHSYYMYSTGVMAMMKEGCMAPEDVLFRNS